MADVQGKKPEENTNGKGMSRRTFIGTGAGLVVGGVAGGLIGSKALNGGSLPTAPASFTDLGGQQHVKEFLSTVPASKAYLVVDSMKCAGCQTCMMACSMVHYGVSDTSLSKIQVVQSAFATYPSDLVVYQCRQCTSPLCVLNCPSGACQIDSANGNVRVIDETKCIGCQKCLSSCPHPPPRSGAKRVVPVGNKLAWKYARWTASRSSPKRPRRAT
jgi:protein NrfC